MAVRESEKKRPMYGFEGKVALVTGAAAGIGRAVALAFTRQGASVVVADVNSDGGNETVRLIEKEGGKAVFHKTDVASEEDVRNVVAFAAERYGKLDFACNNAGVGSGRLPIAELPRERWDLTIGVNLTGVLLCLKYELQQMLKQGSGAIVNVASVASFIGSADMAGYIASKHGVMGLTKTAAIEVARKGIRVNAVAPGVTKAGLTESAPKEFLEASVAAQPIGRMADAQEIAAAILWLCSDESSFVLGHTLPVDGGMTIC
jgi:NAD(P)-dependent dehydrogenase (short-subunit alcohol dehydrogenase family)